MEQSDALSTNYSLYIVVCVCVCVQGEAGAGPLLDHRRFLGCKAEEGRD